MIVFSSSDKDYSVLVTNTRKVNELLGIELEYDDDLTSKNEIPQVKEFLNKYKDLLHSISRKNIKEFYNKTELHIMHVIIPENGPWLFLDNREIFCTGDSNNELKHVDDVSNHDIEEVFHHHLLIITKVKSVLEDKDGVYAIDKENNKICLYNFEEEKDADIANARKAFDIFREFVRSESEGIEASFKVLEENLENEIFKDIEKQEIKQIEYIPYFNYTYTLLKDGTLYENNIIYAKNVRTIWTLTETCYYIIYEDETMELLISSISSMGSIRKHKKVLCEYNGQGKYLVKIDEFNNVEIWEKDELSEHIVVTGYFNVKDLNKGKQNRIFVVCDGDSEEVFTKKAKSCAIPFNAW